LSIEQNPKHGLRTRLLKSQFFRSWPGFSDPCSGLTFRGRIVGKTLRLITSYNQFRKLKSHLKGRLFDSISDIQKAVTSSGLTFSGRIVGKTLRLITSCNQFRKLKSHLKGRLFDSISDIQKAVTSTLNAITKNDFYKGIQKLYDRENLYVHL